MVTNIEISKCELTWPRSCARVSAPLSLRDGDAKGVTLTMILLRYLALDQEKLIKGWSLNDYYTIYAGFVMSASHKMATATVCRCLGSELRVDYPQLESPIPSLSYQVWESREITD